MNKLGKCIGYGFAVVVMLAATGCTTRIGDFSLISTGTPQYANMNRCEVERTVKGKDGRLWFLILPLGTAPSLEEAVDRCMDEASGDHIERARFYTTRWTLGLFSYGSYKVIGDVADSRRPLAYAEQD
ncbi:hypothetical protein ACFLQY_02695 [Verrucomicrobiota bacterium]